MSCPEPRRALPTHHAVAVGRMRFAPADADDAAARPAVTHDHGSVIFTLAGAIEMWVGGVYALGRGDVMLIPEGAPHHRVESRGGEIYGLSVCMSCLTEPWGAELARAFDAVRRGASAVRRIEPARFDRLEGTLDALADELATERPGQALATSGLLSLITVAIARASPVAATRRPAGETPMIADALAHIEQHALEGISLTDVARAVGRAPAHVATVVKRETGRTVGEWIVGARMAFGRQLLLRSDENVEVIAERIGYRSPSHFHRVFRREHGLTPSAWRALHRGGVEGAAQP